jgi:hypothetical protein
MTRREGPVSVARPGPNYGARSDPGLPLKAEEGDAAWCGLHNGDLPAEDRRHR